MLSQILKPDYNHLNLNKLQTLNETLATAHSPTRLSFDKGAKRLNSYTSHTCKE